MDQAIGGSVLVQLGDRALEFARLPDGSYAAPPGVTAALSKQSGQFILDERYGVRWTFNTNGTLAIRQDADSNAVRYAYSPSSTNVTSVSNSFGRVLAFAYSSAGLLTNVSDGTGRSVGYQYTASNLVTCVDPAANSWTYTYDTNHWLTTIRDPLSRLAASNTYSSLGQVQTQMNGASNVWNFYVSGWRGMEKDPQGGQTIHYFDDSGRNLGTENALGQRSWKAYDAQGRLVTNIDARGYATVFQYDASHNLTNRLDALSNRTAYVYDSQSRLTSVIDPLGNMTRYGYDNRHHVTNAVDAITNVTAFAYQTNGLLQSSVSGARTTSYVYTGAGDLLAMTRTDGGALSNRCDAVGNVTNVIDALGRTNRFIWDKRRLLTSDTDAAGFTVSNVYDSAGLLIKTIDRNGNTNQTSYTATYNPDTITLANGGTNKFCYDSRDWLVSVTDPLGHVVSNRYDSAGRKIAVVDPLTNTTSFAFDANGNVITQTNAVTHVTHYAYDPLNRLTNTWDVLSGGTRSVATVFDAAGRLTSTKDADGFITQFQYDALNRKTSVIKPAGTSDHFEYNQFGDLTAFVNAEGRRTEMTYDGMGRQRSVTDPLTNRVAYVFDPVGNLTARTNADGVVVRYQYNSVNGLQKTIYPGGVTNTYSYDKNRLLTNVVDSLGSSRFAYDRMNWQTQAVSVVGSVTSTVAYVFDMKGNRTRVVYPGGLTVTNTFDVADRLASVADWGGRTVSYTYNALHSPTGTVYPNGVKSSFAYDQAARLTNVVYATGSVAFVNRQYTLDAAGNRMQEEINAGLQPTITPLVRRMAQDPADKLTAISEKTNPDSPAWSNYTPTHDANGSMLTDGYGLTLKYDADNRVTNLQSTAIGSRAFFYNGRGEVAKRTLNGTNFIDVLDSTRLLMSRSTNGAALVYYIWGNGLVAQIGSNGVALSCHADGQGNVLALTATNGAVTDQWFYSPYGQVLNRTGSSDMPFQWLGAHSVRYECGSLYRMQHRFYHAGLMRFTSADPIGLAGGANLYWYADGSPLVLLDPSGLQSGGGVVFIPGPNGVTMYSKGLVRTSWSPSGITEQIGPAGNLWYGVQGGAEQTSKGLAAANDLGNPLIGIAVAIGGYPSAAVELAQIFQAYQPVANAQRTQQDMRLQYGAQIQDIVNQSGVAPGTPVRVAVNPSTGSVTLASDAPAFYAAGTQVLTVSAPRPPK
jgi:RHS repeat-associated protein